MDLKFNKRSDAVGVQFNIVNLAVFSSNTLISKNRMAFDLKHNYMRKNVHQVIHNLSYHEFNENIFHHPGIKNHKSSFCYIQK